MTCPSARADRALRKLAETDPALAALSLWCRHRDDPDPEEPRAAWTDGAAIHYGAAFAKLTLPEQMGICAHHILHVALRHAQRQRAMALRLGGDFDAELYGLATDALVNETVLAAGYALPRPAVLLSELMAGAPDSDAAEFGRWDSEKLYNNLMRGGKDAAGSTRRSAAAPESPAQRARRYGAQQGFRPDVEDSAAEAEAGRTDADADAAMWRERVTRALAAGRTAGVGLGAVGHRLADLPEVRTPWELHLRALVTRAVTEIPQPSHRRPARRWLAADSLARRDGQPSPAFEPGTIRRSGVPRIAVGLDCSGSVPDLLLDRFGAELMSIARRSRAEIHVLVFDTSLRDRWIWRPGDGAAALRVRGLPRGGGTDFAPVIAEARSLAASVLVVLTDLDGPLGPAPAGLPVLWALPGDAPPAAPAFGRLSSLAR